MRRLVLALALLLAPRAHAAETCGDGADNDANSMTDEGCSPYLSLGINESPLPFETAGAVSPKLGQLVFPVMADLEPKVAYGPGIPFRRTYMSLYDPGYFGGGASDYRDSLGYRFRHNWMSWLEKFTTPNPDEVVLHTVEGRDILFKFSTNDGNYDKYTPQAGEHFDYLRQKTSAGTGQYDWELRLLTGEVYVYDGSTTGNHVAKLIEVRDTLATPNKVTISYNADGKVYQVKNAGDTKYLQLEYFTTGNKLLQYVRYYADATLRVTVELTYSSDKLSTAKIGGTTVESYSYDANGYLTTVTDGDSKTIASFAYRVNAGGKAIRVNAGDGDIGYEYDGSGCDAGKGTYVYFHRANGNRCDADSECGTGNYCGGETDPAANDTGQCFRARRCVSFTSPNEHLVKDVTGSDGSGTCNSCVGISHYEFWTNSPTNDKIELRGTQTVGSQDDRTLIG